MSEIGGRQDRDLIVTFIAAFHGATRQTDCEVNFFHKGGVHAFAQWRNDKIRRREESSDGPTPEAVALVRDAAGRGYAEAEYHLADLHLEGAGGVPQDTREAKRLFANAAGKGYDDARAKLADLGSSLVEIED